MADAVQINVFPKQGNWFRYTLAQLGFWVPLVGAVAIAETYLGGSWVVNTLALIAGIVWFFSIIGIAGGKYVKLSRGEVIEWVGDGAPADVKAWKDAN